MKIVVLSFKIVPAARPPGRGHPSSARPPGPGPAEPIYIKLPIDRHGRLLLVNHAQNIGEVLIKRKRTNTYPDPFWYDV